MIGVKVSEQHGMHELRFGAEKLQAQLGRRVDQDIAVLRADEHSAAITVIARVRGAAHIAIAADHGNADRGAGAEEGELRGRLGNWGIVATAFWSGATGRRFGILDSVPSKKSKSGDQPPHSKGAALQIS